MKDTPDYRDTLYTIDKSGRRKWVYPHYLPGRYFKLRTIVAYSLLVFYLSLPWISIGGKQGVLLDIPHRRFIFFGLELWATDTIFLFFLLATLGMSLFFFTALLGRVWCGWACPETVFLEFVFRPIERLIEGSDAARRKLDKAPWNRQKIFKKLVKHSLCALLSWVIASTALAYFIGREPLIGMMSHAPLDNPWPFFTTLALMILMAFQFGWFREQFCTVLCPYARFQSVLMDQHSLLVGYDKNRGEPRGKLRAKDGASAGDCIDCGMCIRVCPTGIDIRNGTQLECVACSACIDACDSIMVEIGKPTGLIRYDSEAGLLGKSVRWFRPRVFVYAGILLNLILVFAVKINNREMVDVEIVRVAKDGFMAENENGMVSNQFSLRLGNKGLSPIHFEIKALNLAEAKLITPLPQIELKPGAVQQVPLFIVAPQLMFEHGRRAVELEIRSSDGTVAKRTVTLFGPG